MLLYNINIHIDFAMKVYEFHGRVALQSNDLNEYNQCQTQLKQLYNSYRSSSSSNNNPTIAATTTTSTPYRIENEIITTLTKKGNKKKVVGTVTGNKRNAKQQQEQQQQLVTTEPTTTSSSSSNSEYEFIAYRILYYIYLQYNKTSSHGSSDLAHILTTLSNDAKK